MQRVNSFNLGPCANIALVQEPEQLLRIRATGQAVWVRSHQAVWQLTRPEAPPIPIIRLAPPMVTLARDERASCAGLGLPSELRRFASLAFRVPEWEHVSRARKPIYSTDR